MVRDAMHLIKRKIVGYMRISANIHDMAGEERTLCKILRMHHDGDWR
jgi:hypothetical protein